MPVERVPPVTPPPLPSTARLISIDEHRAKVAIEYTLPYARGREMMPGDTVRVEWLTGVVVGRVEVKDD